MVDDDVSEGSGHSNGLELGEVCFILVETEQVCVGEVRLHVCINTLIENASE